MGKCELKCDRGRWRH